MCTKKQAWLLSLFGLADKIVFQLKLTIHSSCFLAYGELRSLSAIFSPMSLVFHEDSKYATLEIERYVLLVVTS